MSATAAVEDTVRVALDPDLTIIAAAETKARLVAALDGAKVLELDLSSVAEIDTAGLQVLLLVAREARQSGRELRLVGTSKAVDAVFSLAHVGPGLTTDRSAVTDVTDEQSQEKA